MFATAKLGIKDGPLIPRLLSRFWLLALACQVNMEAGNQAWLAGEFLSNWCNWYLHFLPGLSGGLPEGLKHSQRRAAYNYVINGCMVFAWDYYNFQKYWGLLLPYLISRGSVTHKLNGVWISRGSGYGNGAWLFMCMDWWRMVAKFALNLAVKTKVGSLMVNTKEVLFDHKSQH